VVLEYDNATVVQAIKGRNQKLSCMWRTYYKIEIFETRFGNFKVGNTKKESNHAAQELAKLARLSTINTFWMEHVPTEVNPFVSANTVSCGIPMQ
jgi:hypothetical protein